MNCTIGGTSQDGELIELTVVRQLTSRTSWEFLANQRLTYIGELFNRQQGPGQQLQNTQNVAGVADPLEILNLESAIRLANTGSNLFASIAIQDEDYLNQVQLNRNWINVRVGGNFQVSSAWQLNFSITAVKIEFDNNPREDDDLILAVGVGRQISRTFSLDLTHSRVERNSNQLGASYDENVAYLTLRYSR